MIPTDIYSSRPNFFFRQYFCLIDRIQQHPDQEEYQEKHHILPCSIFKESIPEARQLVSVNYKHHLILHYLIWRGYQELYGDENYETVKMAYAMLFMSGACRVAFSEREYQPCSLEKAASIENSVARKDIQALFKKAMARHRRVTTPETCEKISKGRRGCRISEEARKRLSIARTGAGNSMYGKHHTEAAKALMRGPKSEEAKKKQSEAMKGRASQSRGRIKITDGRNVRYVEKTEEVPSGWSRGTPPRLQLKNTGSRGKMWIHTVDNTKEALVNEAPIPVDWARGRIPGKGGYRGKRA